MSQLDLKAFQALTNTTAPSFSSSAIGATNHVYALESTGLREWQWPSARAVRVIGNGSALYSIKFGDENAVAASSNSALAAGNLREVWSVQPGQTHVAIVSSTTITVNFTLGSGQ